MRKQKLILNFNNGDKIELTLSDEYLKEFLFEREQFKIAVDEETKKTYQINRSNINYIDFVKK